MVDSKVAYKRPAYLDFAFVTFVLICPQSAPLASLICINEAILHATGNVKSIARVLLYYQ